MTYNEDEKWESCVSALWLWSKYKSHYWHFSATQKKKVQILADISDDLKSHDKSKSKNSACFFFSYFTFYIMSSLTFCRWWRLWRSHERHFPVTWPDPAVSVLRSADRTIPCPHLSGCTRMKKISLKTIRKSLNIKGKEDGDFVMLQQPSLAAEFTKDDSLFGGCYTKGLVGLRS